MANTRDDREMPCFFSFSFSSFAQAKEPRKAGKFSQTRRLCFPNDQVNYVYNQSRWNLKSQVFMTKLNFAVCDLEMSTFRPLAV